MKNANNFDRRRNLEDQKTVPFNTFERDGGGKGRKVKASLCSGISHVIQSIWI